MPDGDGIHGTHHIVAALRTALIGRTVIRFDHPRMDGPAPTPGRVIERVEALGKHVHIVWDDGLILDTNLRLSGVWHLYREGEPWRRSSSQLRVAITVPGWVAACFNAPSAETYREFDRYRHPGFGPCGPNIAVPGAELGDAVRRMAGYFDPDAAVAEVLLDPQVVVGVGNVYRSEAMWACAVHPAARIGDLSVADCARLVQTAAALLRANIELVASGSVADTRDGLLIYGRNGQRCDRCGDTIEVRRIDDHARLLYFCAGCQTQFDPHLPVREEPVADPHPAAEKFMGQLPWRRNDLAG